MINYKIREFEDKVIDLFNTCDLQIEIKRIIAQNVLDKITQKSDEIIKNEIQELKKEEKKDGIQSDSLCE